MLERHGVRTRAFGICAVAVALLPHTTSAAHSGLPMAPSVASTYSFAQSSLAGGGFENVIAADPWHKGVVLSGSDVAGIDRSTDFGTTWSAAQGGSLVQTGNSVAAIAFDPKTRNDVYAATNTGVAESTNDGVSWTPLTPGPTFNGSNTSNPTGTPGSERCVGNLVAIDDSTSPARVYAASFNDGVWMYNATSSALSEGTWSSVATEADLGNAACLTSLAWGPDRTLDVSTWGGTAGVYTISDPGASNPGVQAIPGAPGVVQELVGLSDGDVWGAAYGNGVGEITTSGNWVSHDPSGGAPGQNYMSIAGYVLSGADVVIAGSDTSPQYDVLHETMNSGSTWASLPSETAPDNVSTDLLGGSANPWWHGTYQPALLWSTSMVPSSIAMEHEKTGDNLWIAGYGGNWRLLGAQGQTTFYPSDWGIGSTVNHQVAIDPSTLGDPRSSESVYLGDTDWGMLSSADGFNTQQGISDDRWTSSGTDVLDTVVEGGVSTPVVYDGVGNRNTNTQGDLLWAPAPATSATAFHPTGLGAATGGGRPLAVGVVDTSGTPTLVVAVEDSGIWTRVGSEQWAQDTSLFMSDPKNIPTGAIAVGSGAQADTVYAYYPQVGVYRSQEAGAPGTWTEIWANTSVATAPFLMVDSADPTTLWVSAKGGLYELDNAATATLSTYAAISPVIAGNTFGLAELNGQVFTTEFGASGLEVLVSDTTGAHFTDVSNGALSETQATVSSLAVANDGTVYIATTGSGLIVGTPVDPTTTSLSSTPDPSKARQLVTFTATVAATAIGGVPTGVVVFWNGTRKLGMVTLNASGIASLSTKALKMGSHSIVAKYQGNPGDHPSTSNTIVQTVT